MHAQGGKGIAPPTNVCLQTETNPHKLYHKPSYHAYSEYLC